MSFCRQVKTDAMTRFDPIRSVVPPNGGTKKGGRRTARVQSIYGRLIGPSESAKNCSEHSQCSSGKEKHRPKPCTHNRLSSRGRWGGGGGALHNLGLSSLIIHNKMALVYAARTILSRGSLRAWCWSGGNPNRRSPSHTFNLSYAKYKLP